MNFDTYRCSRPLKLNTRIPNNETDTLANEEVLNQSHLHSSSNSSPNSYNFNPSKKNIWILFRTDTNIHLLRLQNPPPFRPFSRRFISTSHPQLGAGGHCSAGRFCRYVLPRCIGEGKNPTRNRQGPFFV